MKQSPPWKANSSSVKKFPVFYVTRNFLNVSAGHLFLSWARSVQAAPQSYVLDIHFSTPVCFSVYPSSVPTRILRICVWLLRNSRIICNGILNSNRILQHW